MRHLIQQQRSMRLREDAHDGWRLALHAQGCLSAYRSLRDEQTLNEAELTLKQLEDRLHAIANSRPDHFA